MEAEIVANLPDDEEEANLQYSEDDDDHEEVEENGGGDGADVPVPILRDPRFPFELWKLILQYVHIADNRQLWKCRKVDRDLKKLSDEVLKEKASLWTTTYENDWASFLKRIKGTRLTSKADLKKFVRDMERCEQGYPFPNGVLILVPENNEYPGSPSPPPLQELHLKFGSFLMSNKIRDSGNLTSLVYSFDDNASDVEVISQILNIFKLKNLRRLVIQKKVWNVFSKEAKQLITNITDIFDAEIGLPFPENLTELQIYGVVGIFSCLFLIFTLFPNIAPCLKKLRLTINTNIIWRICDDPENLTELQIYGVVGIFSCLFLIFTLFPNIAPCLKKLRLTINTNIIWRICDDYDVTLLTRILAKPAINNLSLTSLKTDDASVAKIFLGPFSTSLKELTFILEYFGRDAAKAQPVGEKISALFRTLDGKTATKKLESLQLSIDEGLIHEAEGNELEFVHGINEDIHYPKVAHLVVEISTIYGWKELTKVLIKKLSELKKVTLFMKESDVEYAGASSPKQFHDFLCSSIWQKFPEGVELIHVPYFGWKLRRNQRHRPDFQC